MRVEGGEGRTVAIIYMGDGMARLGAGGDTENLTCVFDVFILLYTRYKCGLGAVRTW